MRVGEIWRWSGSVSEDKTGGHDCTLVKIQDFGPHIGNDFIKPDGEEWVRARSVPSNISFDYPLDKFIINYKKVYE